MIFGFKLSPRFIYHFTMLLILLFLVPAVSGLANPTSVCRLLPTRNGFECNASWTHYTVTTSGWQIKAESTGVRPLGMGRIHLQYESVNGDNYTVCSTFCKHHVDDHHCHTRVVSDASFTIWIGCNNKIRDCKLNFNVTMRFPGVVNSPPVLFG